MSRRLDGLLEAACAEAAGGSRAPRLARHMPATLLIPERSTVTNLICTSGGQHEDWSAHYRLYSRERVDESLLFGHALEAALAHLPPGAPVVVGVDDTIVRKTGTRIHGSGWRRDPLGPAFQTNLVRGQRYLQCSVAWPVSEQGEARMVPVDFRHAPPPAKAAGARQNQQGQQGQQGSGGQDEPGGQNLGSLTVERLALLRERVPASRPLVFVGDGGFTNRRVINGRPPGTVYVGRCRKDLALHHPSASAPAPATGRPRAYGGPAPTPEALRTDGTVPWLPVKAFAAGRVHDFKVKLLGPVLWRKTGPAQPLAVLVVAPLGYRLRKGHRILYRKPAYLLCTDPDMPLAEVLQDFLWRWGIEVNFRDEKNLAGTGEAQVRTAASNQHLPAVTVAAYSLLWTAALSLRAEGRQPPMLAPPKWRPDRRDTAEMPSTGDLLRLLRYEIWAGVLRPSTFFHFVSGAPPVASDQKPPPDLAATLFCSN